jgi:AraC family transcriptional regulator
LQTRPYSFRSRFDNEKGANMNSNDDTFSQSGSSMPDVRPSAFFNDQRITTPDPLDFDDTLASLLAVATVALDTDPRVTRRCIRRAAALLGIDVTRPDAAAARSCLRTGLPSWQADRLRSYIESNLDSTIRATELARVVRLSTSHFFRAFRKSFGESPAAYIMKRRVLRAQGLMLKSRMPLSQVALDCGMCDQPHLSRAFRRIVGTTPAAWRRQFILRPMSREGARAGARGPRQFRSTDRLRRRIPEDRFSVARNTQSRIAHSSSRVGKNIRPSDERLLANELTHVGPGQAPVDLETL